MDKTNPKWPEFMVKLWSNWPYYIDPHTVVAIGMEEYALVAIRHDYCEKMLERIKKDEDAR